MDAPKNPRLALQADHAQIEALLDHLVPHVLADERTDALRVWTVLERVLLAHIDGEEAYLLPTLEALEPDECARVRAEHAQIRRTMGELGMALELHAARAEPITAFCTLLRAHAEREDVLYAAAERHMPVATARSLLSRLQGRASLARFQGSQGADAKCALPRK